ncbi:uncharacterized protein LY79DRAFT_385901 [Colletotrichum navitas]|uniref:Uncharacterized protein n=1 Tax=Colletotrichum navitas TaxID=681940 RepID=A0AAD8Q805_9PEZI|nr:uncharacterized protein LY79DRAFT_385901 [Colletotrichum navitas]KAK1597445.1 hypothetical protein LY79DRAFT_385901 [Colletotrichum navitas]
MVRPGRESAPAGVEVVSVEFLIDSSRWRTSNHAGYRSSPVLFDRLLPFGFRENSGPLWGRRVRSGAKRDSSPTRRKSSRYVRGSEKARHMARSKLASAVDDD